MALSFEVGPIRPPSEAYSLLIRATRNCPWNRCKFCHTYKGEKFQLRTVAEVKDDITTARTIQDKIKELAWKSGCGDRLKEFAGAVFNSSEDEAFRHVALWLHAGGENAFLQDANTLVMKTSELVEIIKFLKETLPSIKRVTSYGRAQTAVKKKFRELVDLREAGLSRLHIGLETGYDPLLQYMDKGVTSAEHIAGGRKVVASGISLCEYVILGLGGRTLWREHATATARVLNEISPTFIRVRTLSINERMPLDQDIRQGKFIRATDEEIVEEERDFIERLTCTSSYVSDHVTNLLPEVEGKLPEDKNMMLAVIESFQELPPAERANFRLGRRLGIYQRLSDRDDLRRRQVVEQVMAKVKGNNGGIDEQVIYSMMGKFI